MGHDTVSLECEREKRLMCCMFSTFNVANAIDIFTLQSNKLLIIEKTIVQQTNCHLLWLNIMIRMEKRALFQFTTVLT